MKFTLTRVAKPDAPLLTLAEAQAQLRVDTFGSPPSNPEDEIIADLVEAATEELDAGTGWLGRALMPQTWRLGLDRLPGTARGGIFGVNSAYAIRLPYPPFISILSFTYNKATDGTLVTLTEGTDFRVLEYDDQAMVAPLYGALWPTDVRCDFDSVQIVFRCGYQSGSPPTPDVPKIIRNFVKSRLTDLFDSRGVDAIIGNRTVQSDIGSQIPNALNQIRKWTYEP